MRSMIAASVVDLPEPVGPVTSTSPCCRWARLSIGRRQVELLERHDRLGDEAEDGARRRSPGAGSWRGSAPRRRGRRRSRGRRARSYSSHCSSVAISRSRARTVVVRRAPASRRTGSSAPWTRMRGSQPGGQVEVGAAAVLAGSWKSSSRRGHADPTPPVAPRTAAAPRRGAAASSRVTTPVLAPARRARRRAAHMPCAAPVCSTERIWKVLFSRIRLATALLATRISSAGTRPLPSARRTRRCETTARSDSETMVRICVLLLRREDAEEAVDGADGVVGVQGGEHQVAGLGGGEGERDGLEVAQLADRDDVGVLAQGGAQGAGEGAGVRARPGAG